MSERGLPSIAWILEASSMSGGVRIIYEMANRLSARGFPVMFLSLGERPKWFNINGKIKWYYYGSYGTLTAAAEHLRPDVVIATWWKTAYVAAAIQEKLKCRGLYLVQDIETSYYFDPVTRSAALNTYTLGLEHFTTSKWVMEQLPKCSYVGLAIGRWNNRAEGSRQRAVLACMRRQALKGFRELAEVSRYLNARGTRLATYGPDIGVKFSSLHEHNFGLKLVPTDRDLERAYSHCGVFISTSRHEGFSLTPLEAMACGTPVVMFDADGNMEYADDGVNCLIASDPLNMSEKISAVLEHRDLAARLSKAGLETAARYRSWDGPIDRLESVLTITE